ncbi:MAG: FxLYD domain-containing protein, partial [Planococcaceae bacterium]|nr:FxLYD domain-containing protein [Planococcaceae bacterium]
ASIGDIQVNFEGADGSVLGTDTMLSATPGIIQPGETAYITTSTTLDGYAETDFAKASLNLDFDTVSEEAQLLKADATKLVDLSADEYAYSPYKVTGTIINDSEEKSDDIRIASGLYDAEGKLLGVLEGSLQVSLNPEGKAGFELTYPELPKDIGGKATEVKVKAYNWTW